MSRWVTRSNYSLFFILITFVNIPFVFAQAEPPQFFTLDGRLFVAGSATEPLLDPSVSLTIQILNPARTCILYEEVESVNTLGTNGFFTARIGSATGASEREPRDSNNSMKTVFVNSGLPITGQNQSGGACTYTPVAGETRQFRFFITPSTVGSTAQLSDDMQVDSVPQALVAQTLQGLDPSNIFQTSATSTQAKLDNLLTTNYNALSDVISGTSGLYLRNDALGTQLPTRTTDPGGPAPGQIWYDSLANEIKYFNGSTIQSVGAAGAGISSLTAGAGLSGGTITTSGTIAIDALGVTNAMLATGIDASKITAGTLPVGVVPTNTDTTKLPLAGGTLTGAVTMGAATTFAGFDLLNTGHITMSAQRTIIIGRYDSAQQITLVGTLTGANTGATWFNTTTGKLMFWNGTAAFEVSETTSSGGDITAITTNTGSGLTGGVLSGPATLAVNVDNTTIEVATNTIQLKDGGISAAKLAADSVTTAKILDGEVTNAKINTVSVSKIASGAAEYFSYMPAGTECATGEVLKWDAATNRWLCNTDLTGITDHGALTGLSDDDHAQYVLLAGRVGGQTLSGGSAASNNLILDSTSDVTKGHVILQPTGGNVGVGTTVPSAKLSISENDGTIFGNTTINRYGYSTTRFSTDVNSAKLFFSKARGTESAAVLVNANDSMGGVIFRGHDGTGREEAAAIEAFVDGSPGADDMPGRLVFSTTPDGSNNLLERMRIASSGNVGIGTTAPAVSLDLNTKTDAVRLPAGTDGQRPTAANGMIRYNTTSNKMEAYENGAWVNLRDSASNTTIAAASGSVSAPSLSFNGDTNTGFYNSSADTIGVSVGGVNSFDFNSTGLVSPTVGGASVTTNNGTAATPTYSFAGDPDTGWFRADTDTLAASTAGAERVRIGATGRVGIGAASPATKTHIITTDDNSGVDGLLIENINTGANGATLLFRKNRGTIGAQTAALNGDRLMFIGGTGDAGSGFPSSKVAIVGVATEDHTGAGRGTSMLLATTPNGASTRVVRMTIDQSGFVGIGTTVPSTTLDVASDAASTPTGTLRNNFDNNAYYPTLSLVRMRSSGTSPTADFGTGLDIRAEANTNGSTDSIGSFTAAWETTPTGAPTRSSYVTIGNRNADVFSEKMRITAAGNVGIGTTVPVVSLDFDTKTDGVRFPAGTDGQRPTGANGILRYNTTSNKFEGYENGAWVNLRDLASNSTVTAATGTAAVPSLSFTGELDTGFYNSGTNAIGVSAGGAQLFQFTTAGLVSPTAGGGYVLTGNGTAATPTYTFAGDSDTGWFSPTADTLAASTAGVERMRINLIGSVAIGTTVASAKLTVSGTPYTDGTIESIAELYSDTASSTNAGGGMTFGGRYTGGGSYTTFSGIRGRKENATSGNSAGVLTLATRPNGGAISERMRIDSLGNVGIGTTTPSYILSINGDAAQTIGMERKSGNDIGESLTVLAGGASVAGNNRSGGTLNLSSGASTGIQSSRIDFLTATGGSSGTTTRSPSTKMTILGNGNVGIGTTTPGSALDINGAKTMLGIAAPSVSSAGQGRIYFDSTSNKYRVSQNGGAYADLVSSGGTPAGSNNQIQFNDAGSFGASSTLSWNNTTGELTVGLAGGGTSSVPINARSNTPTASISISNYALTPATSDFSSYQFRLSGTGGSGSVRSEIRSYSDDPTTATFDSSLRFFTSIDGTLGERLRIDNAGNVGIGTTIPGTKLDVDGAITSRPSNASAGNTGRLVLNELVANGAASAALRVPDDLAASYILTLPVDDGTSGQVLSTDGAGVLSWITAPVSGGTLLAGDGSSAAPSIGFTNDTNTGFFLYGVDAIGVTMGGIVSANLSNDGWNIFRRIRADNGSTAEPEFSFNLDQDTGVSNPAANVLGFSTGGSERVRISASGDVGIGSVTPAAKLDVVGTTKLGAAGVAFASMGGCNLSSFTIAAGANARTCTGLPAGAVVHCSPSASQGASNPWSAWASGSGTVTLNIQNAGTAATWACMWMVP